MHVRHTLVCAATVALLLTLGACGTSDSGTDTGTNPESNSSAVTTTASAEGPSEAPSADPKQMQAVQDCLDAAGIELDLPSGMPTEAPTDMPSGMPTDLPSDLASGGPFADPQVQAALKACGIEMPTARSGP